MSKLTYTVLEVGLGHQEVAFAAPAIGLDCHRAGDERTPDKILIGKIPAGGADKGLVRNHDIHVLERGEGEGVRGGGGAPISSRYARVHRTKHRTARIYIALVPR